jgi:hypothetical protein
MKMHSFVAASAALAVLSSLCSAQTGVLDQSSPYPGTGWSAGYNGSASSLVWQQQVRAGITGQLEGVTVHLNGSVGSHIDVRIRAGDGWNTSAVLFQGVATKLTASYDELCFLDATSALVNFTANSTFVIELQGQDDGGGFIGNYSPPPMPAQYPEPLYLGSPQCFVDCHYRIAFETYVLVNSPPLAYCTAGTSSSGCAANISAASNPTVTYSAPCQISVNNVEGQKAGIVFYGLQQTTQPWCSQGGGTSFLCVKAPTKRTGVQNSGGTAGLCDGSLSLNWNSFQQNNPGALGAPWSAGQYVYLQAWYRDPPSCKTTSLSNGLRLTYLP